MSNQPKQNKSSVSSIGTLIQLRSDCAKFLKPIGLSESVVYNFVKQASFFSKKEQRMVFTFVSGLNTNPQNLSIFLRDKVDFLGKNSKQKLSKGQFIVYDMFNQTDCVVQINIPGNFQIYKIRNSKKQLISNNEIDSMYVSSILRSMYDKNICWGKCYNLFGTKNMIEQFKNFVSVLFCVIQKTDIFISQDFQNKSTIKGSHSCSIVFEYIQSKRIIHNSIALIDKQITKRGGYGHASPKMSILLAQLYRLDGKYTKSLSIISGMMAKFDNQPYLMYYEAKYMLKLMAVHEALTLINSIVQFNQYQIWCLCAEIHIQLKNYSEALMCLNHASRLGAKSIKNIKVQDNEAIYGEFQKLGKKNQLGLNQDLHMRPKLMSISENPLSILGSIQEKYKTLVDNDYWRINCGMRNIYDLLRVLRYRLDNKKFQQLLEHTFDQSKKKLSSCHIPQRTYLIHITQLNLNVDTARNEEELPQFLKDQSMEIQSEQIAKGNRNLSIIPELESVIQNSQFEERQKQLHKLTPIKHKKELNEHFFRVLRLILSQGQIQKAQYEQNWAKVLPVYNKLRTAVKLNNFYTKKMFQIMLKLQNYRSVLVLIAECLDAYEQLGSKKIQFLPFWMQRYIFQIIEEKGLKFLNGVLEKANFFDQAVIDAIQLAKNWKIKGCTF